MKEKLLIISEQVEEIVEKRKSYENSIVELEEDYDEDTHSVDWYPNIKLPKKPHPLFEVIDVSPDKKEKIHKMAIDIADSHWAYLVSLEDHPLKKQYPNGPGGGNLHDLSDDEVLKALKFYVYCKIIDKISADRAEASINSKDAIINLLGIPARKPELFKVEQSEYYFSRHKTDDYSYNDIHCFTKPVYENKMYDDSHSMLKTTEMFLEKPAYMGFKTKVHGARQSHPERWFDLSRIWFSNNPNRTTDFSIDNTMLWEKDQQQKEAKRLSLFFKKNPDMLSQFKKYKATNNKEFNNQILEIEGLMDILSKAVELAERK